MNAVLHPQALDHLAYWVGKDPKTAAKILALIEDAHRNPFRCATSASYRAFSGFSVAAILDQ